MTENGLSSHIIYMADIQWPILHHYKTLDEVKQMKSSTYLEPYKHHEYVPVQVGFIIIMIWSIKSNQYHM